MPRRFRFVPLALAVSFAASLSLATTVVHMDTRALVQRSNDIVIGTVEGSRSYWSADHTRILTDITVSVSETLKGDGSNQLVLTQLGGELDGMRYHIEGSPSFARGEEALLFVWRDPQGRAQVSGLSQGKFEIGRDTNGARVVQRAGPGLAFRDPRSLRALPEGTVPGRVTLDDMKREIETVMKEGGR
jgi:hypothetical protein